MNEIKQLINRYIEQNKYISCLEELYVLFEKNNVSFQERTTIMKEIYKYNKKIYAIEQKKSQKLDNMEKDTKRVKSSEEPPVPMHTKTKKKVEPLQCDITSFMDEIKNFNDMSDLERILPSRDSEQFDNVIDMICVALYREKVEILNLIHEHQEKDPSIHQYFDNELEDIDCRIEMLLDYKNAVIEEEENTNKKTTNKIVFLKNSLGEPMIISSLKGYEEYYDSFLELINSIIDGTFKNKRTFLNNNKIVDMMEVKGFKTRILFSRLRDNIFVVMPAFVKKCDTDLRHRNLIQKVSQMHQMQKDTLMCLVDDEEFMLQEKHYLEELIKMLEEKKKVILK